MFGDPGILNIQPEHPSQAFVEFIRNYFDIVGAHGHEKPDPSTFEALMGAEREIAVKLVVTNLDRRLGQFVRLAGHAKIRECIPKLRTMLAEGWREPIDLLKALVALGGVSDDELVDALRRVFDGDSDLDRYECVDLSLWSLPFSLGAEFVRRSFHDSDPCVIASGFEALLTMELVGKIARLPSDDRVEQARTYWFQRQCAGEWRQYLDRTVVSDPALLRSNIAHLERRLARAVTNWPRRVDSPHADSTDRGG